MAIPQPESEKRPRSMQERPTRVRYGVIWFAVTLAVITYIDRVCISFSAPSIREELHLSVKQMGWAFGAFGWAYALFEIPGGYLGDRIGPRKVLMRIVLWWSFFTAATGWVRNLPSLVATRFFFGMGEAGCFPNLTKAFTTWLPERERVRAQGIMWFAARWGGAFTPPLVAWVTGLVGWRHAFEIFGSIGVIWALIFYAWFRDNPLDNPKLNDAERTLLQDSARLAKGHGAVPWSTFIVSKQVWMLCWQYFCLSYGWYFYVTWLPTYLREGRHLEITSTALLSTIPLAFGGVGNPVSVALGAFFYRTLKSVTLTRKLIACLGFTGSAAFLLVSTRMQDPTMAVLAIGMASFCNDLVMPHAWGAAMDIGGKHAGTLSGAMNMWGNVGGAISPMAIGYILEWTGNSWNLTFYISAAIYLLGIVCWLMLDPVTELKERREYPYNG